MKRFSKAKFIEAEGMAVYNKCKDWVDECDGKTVVGGEVAGMASDRAWEENKEWEQSRGK